MYKIFWNLLLKIRKIVKQICKETKNQQNTSISGKEFYLTKYDIAKKCKLISRSENREVWMLCNMTGLPHHYYDNCKVHSDLYTSSANMREI